MPSAEDRTAPLNAATASSLSPVELERLEKLANSQSTFVPMGEQFDRITRTAMRLFDVPVSLVNGFAPSRVSQSMNAHVQSPFALGSLPRAGPSSYRTPKSRSGLCGILWC
jgi:hypothetical protein